jgi:hypothetical protein
MNKTLVIILAFAVWGCFALQYPDMVPAYIQALRDALIAMGAFHAATPQDGTKL